MARSFTAASSQYLEYSGAVLDSYPFSISIWFYIASSAKTGVAFAEADTGVAEDDYIDLLTVNNNLCQYNARMGGAGAVNLNSTDSYTVDTWQHMGAKSASASSHAIYVNGGTPQTDSTNIGTFSSIMDVTDIGVLHRNSFAAYFDGYLAECALWSANLSDGEFAALAAGYSPLLVRSSSLIAYWPLIRDTDDDRVGGYDMTPSGSPTIAAHAPVIMPTTQQVFHFAPTGIAALDLNFAYDNESVWKTGVDIYRP